ncbi:MAG: hypothetical protein R3B09_10665 [Nannocystaceae bacterium]
MKIDEVLKVRTRRRPGNFARFAQAVADVGGLIEEIETLSVGEDYSVRMVTVELPDESATGPLMERVGALDGIEVLERVDRVFKLHEGGKIASRSTVAIDKPSVLRSVYTPGVARVCTAIAEEPLLARRYTSIGSTVGIFTNGTRVLGLGDIGPQASMPVMEGKAALYSEMIGLSAVPILVDTRDVDLFVDTVVRIAPTFGGIHLEDIESPACFEIERRIDDALSIPVMHDDRHGTAVAVLAGLMRACQQIGVDLHDLVVAQIGLGAAGVGIADLMLAYGVKELLAVDPRKENLSRVPGSTGATLDQAMAAADVIVATTGRPGLIDPAKVRRGQVIFAISNPYPEIDAAAALAAGARFATDGRHVNNLLGFPGLFKGAMVSGSERIDHAMKIAAAEVIAAHAKGEELMPDALDRGLHAAVAEAVVRVAGRAAE